MCEESKNVTKKQLVAIFTTWFEEDSKTPQEWQRDDTDKDRGTHCAEYLWDALGEE